jgi:hypothetical protein
MRQIQHLVDCCREATCGWPGGRKSTPRGIPAVLKRLSMRVWQFFRAMPKRSGDSSVCAATLSLDMGQIGGLLSFPFLRSRGAQEGKMGLSHVAGTVSPWQKSSARWAEQIPVPKELPDPSNGALRRLSSPLLPLPHDRSSVQTEPLLSSPDAPTFPCHSRSDLYKMTEMK